MIFFFKFFVIVFYNRSGLLCFSLSLAEFECFTMAAGCVCFDVTVQFLGVGPRWRIQLTTTFGFIGSLYYYMFLDVK